MRFHDRITPVTLAGVERSWPVYRAPLNRQEGALSDRLYVRSVARGSRWRDGHRASRLQAVAVIQNSVEINRSPEELFDYLADPKN